MNISHLVLALSKGNARVEIQAFFYIQLQIQVMRDVNLIAYITTVMLFVSMVTITSSEEMCASVQSSP